MSTLAVVGAGNWGRNLIRNFYQMPGAELRWVVDQDPERLSMMSGLFPGIRTSTDLADVLADPEVRGVVVAASASAHHGLAKAALLADRHVYVEKPLALTVEDAEELVAISSERELTLMTGHLLLYHPGVVKLRELVTSGALGEIYYLYSQRVNLGVIRRDENALWSFAPHDLSVMLFLLGEMPVSVSARGAAYIQPGVEDVVFVNLRFADGRMGQVQLSWLDPHKLRKFTVVGSKKMAVFDDMEPQEKIRVFDKGADAPAEYAGFGDYIGLRFGDIWSPRVDGREPLRLECEHFLECMESKTAPRSDGRNGLDVVRVLDAASRSLGQDGAPVDLE